MKRRRRKGPNKLIVFLILSIDILFAVTLFGFIESRPKVVRAVTIEAGRPMVDVEKFLVGKYRKGHFLTDIKTLDLSQAGKYRIKIKVGEKIYTSLLKIIDTKKPKAKAVDQTVCKNAVLNPATFITDIADVSNVNIYFKEKPDVSQPGSQKVVVVLEDASRNKAEIEVNLTVLDKEVITVEAGSIKEPGIKDFLSGEDYQEASFVTDISTLDISKPASYDVVLRVDGREKEYVLQVVDTTAPKAMVMDQEIWQNEKPEAKSFVTDIHDVSNVTVTYKENPDFSIPGEQQVMIVLKDESNNKTELEAVLHIKEDTEPPVIKGAMDRTVTIGDSLSYKKGITVTDNNDAEIRLKIDNSKVNLKKQGKYQAIYSASDTSGNIAEKAITITVKKMSVTQKKLNERVEEILGEIVREDMTKEEKAEGIYVWIRGHVGYSGTSDKSDWVAEAYRGIKNAKGDCFTFYAVSRALLTGADIENQTVTRVGGRTKHYWNLIDCGDGWYHFDACPNRDKKKTFMMTDAEVEKLTEERGNNYYNFDHTLLPATPKE